MSNKNNIYKSVTEVCHKRLLKDKDTIQYLFKRKINADYIDKFQLGLFPQDLKKIFVEIDPRELRKSGIIKNASYSKFKLWNLVMPIRDVYGRYISMAGRALKDNSFLKEKGLPKYMNLPYKKGQHLFGLSFAKKEILNSGKAYVVEGYFDVISAHQNGLKNVVATCGKFFSKRQMALLSRYANKIVLIFDNEPETQVAASQIVEKNKTEHTSLLAKNPFPKDINDMDEFLVKHTPSKVIEVLNEASEYQNINPIWK